MTTLPNLMTPRTTSDPEWLHVRDRRAQVQKEFNHYAGSLEVHAFNRAAAAHGEPAYVAIWMGTYSEKERGRCWCNQTHYVTR